MRPGLNFTLLIYDPLKC